MTDAENELERRLTAIDAALDVMETPEPPSLRQLIIAAQPKIRRKLAEGHRLPAIRDALVTAGIDIKLGTLRDYLYNGEPSAAGRAAKIKRGRKKADAGSGRQEASKVAVAPFILPSNATEATAGGHPVRARKMV